MKKYHKLVILGFTLLLSLYYMNSSSQPILTGLSGNPQLIKEAQKQTFNQKGKTEYENIKLPFFDDFSYSSPYPDPALWLDRQAFVNSTFPIRPPSIGVATLDALNEFGEIYPHALTVPFPADTLTSRPIRLDSLFNPKRPIRISDSLYFSFYYQPGGGKETLDAKEWERIGNKPDRGDDLILEFGYDTGDTVFYDFLYVEWTADSNYQPGDSIFNPHFLPDSIYYYFTTHVFEGEIFLMPSDSLYRPLYVWNEIWRSEECSLDDWLAENPLLYFKQVMIPIVEEDYLRDNFQFRFRNYASLEDKGVMGWAGNVDQWHIDYVMLDVNRNAEDIYPNDVAFVSPTTSILKKYDAMPWNQFRQNDLKSSFHNRLSNLFSEQKSTSYECTVFKNGKDSIGGVDRNQENALPYYNNGLHDTPYHTAPIIRFELPRDAADSAFFVITHVFEVVGTGDNCRRNDTCIHIQKFHNYYAYDDGTAEAGYSLLSTMTQPHAYLALRFDLAQPDTLRAVRMWFNKVLNNANFSPFSIKVWTVDNKGLPGTELYSQEALMPRHASEYFDFVTYFLDEPLVVLDSFFVGFYQNNKVQLNIGFDQNNDAHEFTYYKTATNWEQSYYKGSPMIRPVMGKYFSTTNIPEHKEKEKIQFTVYPNPTTGELRIENYELRIKNVEVYDIYGRKLNNHPFSPELNSGLNSQLELDISHLPAGIYFVRVLSENEQAGTVKIVKL